MKELSIFIDESGDFGEVKERPAYYLVTFVFHNQDDNIEQQVSKLEESVRTAGFDVEYIHTGPVIRREEIFGRYTIDERRKLLYKMLNFVNSCPISYLTVVVDRKEATNKIVLSGKLAKAINISMSQHQEFFGSFDKIIVYYDNGQTELSAILNADCDKICIENPVPMKIFNLPMYSQVVEPFYFGVPVSKKTYLWLKGLTFLCPTKVVKPIYTFETFPLFKNSHGKYRQKNRSKTFEEVAFAMALSWG